jgi:virginiamycin B lyase
VWRLPGERPRAYGRPRGQRDAVWRSKLGTNALVRFVPERNTFDVLPSPIGNVRQLLGRPGEVWGVESGADKLVVRTR